MSRIFRIPDRSLDERKEEKAFKLGVIGISPCCGVSFVAERVLVKGLYQDMRCFGKNSLVELGKPHFYSALAMDQRFKGREFYDFGKASGFCFNEELGHGWALKLPGEEYDDASLFKALYGPKKGLSYMICPVWKIIH